MNVEEYISTGILEAYAYGDVTAQERADVERQLALHPELREELRKIEETQEALAMKGAIAPSSELKRTIMAATRGEAKEISLSGKSSPVFIWKYAAAASIVVALVASYYAYSYRTRWEESQAALDKMIAQNQQMANEYNVVNQKLDKIQGDLSIIENTAFRKVVMKGTPGEANAMASVYWNESTKETYLSIQNLKEISKENQFQLWAIVNGKPVDMGVFDKNFSGLLKMKSIASASAFAVTIEIRGGKESPTLETMQVVGAVGSKS